jgi:VWFA-related protein
MRTTVCRLVSAAAVGLAVLATPYALPAQKSQPAIAPSQAEISVRQSGFTIRSQVNLVSVPVVVRDSHGRAVGHLSRDNFQIIDSGKPQLISKFSVERFGEAASQLIEAQTSLAPAKSPSAEPIRPPLPERFVAFFFDDLNTEFSDLASAREAVLRYMRNFMRPFERAAVVTASGLTTLDFTNDREKLRQTLLAIHPQEGAVQNAADCPPISIFQADLIVNSSDPVALGTAVQDYLACSNSSTSAPEAAPAIFNFARMHVNLADRSIRRALGALDALLRKMNTMAGQRVIVMASSGIQMLNERRRDELDVFEQAIRSGVIVNTLDARGLYTSIPGGRASDRNTANVSGTEMRGFIGGAGTYSISPAGVAATGNSSVSSTGRSTALIRDEYYRQELLAKRATLAEVASATGGHFFENSNDLDAGITRLAAAPEYLYVIGFSPQDLKSDGKFHSLKVTLRDSHGFTVEARKGYYAPHSSAEPAQRTEEQVEEAVFSRSVISDIPVALQTQFSKTSADKATLSITARVGLSEVSFRKEQRRNHAELTVVTGLFDGDGNYVSGIQKVFEMRLRDETLQASPGLTVRNQFEVAPGTYLVRFVVHDVDGQVLASKNATAEIP